MHDKRWAVMVRSSRLVPGQGYQLHILGKISPPVNIDPQENIMKLSALIGDRSELDSHHTSPLLIFQNNF